jgi:protease IV
MLRFTVCLAIAILMLVGCQHRPLLMRGAMDVDGDMKMSGDMNMTGGMNMAGQMATTMKTDNTASRLKSITVTGQPHGSGKIAIVDVDGPLIEQNLSGFGSMGENPVSLFHEKLEAISSDPSIQAIVLRINSPGGGVTASDIMAHDLERVKNTRQIPVVACLMGVGAGGGYYLATHADAIIAHPTSVVGGIGVILNHYNLEDTMGQFNILSMPVKSGEKIDLGSPERELDDDEREWLQKMADEFHVRFINQVRQSRTQLADLQNDATLFDGRVMTGDQALDQALVDQVGYLDDAIEVARQKAGLAQDAGIVMLRRDNDRAYTVHDVTPNQPMQASLIPFKLPGLERSSLPTFLYLWQPDPSMGARL